MSYEFVSAAFDEVRAVSRRLKVSRKWQKLVLADQPGPTGARVYHNNIYEVNCWRHSTGWPFGNGEWALLGISSKDGEARHDWRDFQHIKNDLVGPEWEAIELYPAESRLIDPSNYFYLWCAPKIPVGRYEGRRVAGPSLALAPQRGWHKEEGPA